MLFVAVGQAAKQKQNASTEVLGERLKTPMLIFFKRTHVRRDSNWPNCSDPSRDQLEGVEYATDLCTVSHLRAAFFDART